MQCTRQVTPEGAVSEGTLFRVTFECSSRSRCVTDGSSMLDTRGLQAHSPPHCTIAQRLMSAHCALTVALCARPPHHSLTLQAAALVAHFSSATHYSLLTSFAATHYSVLLRRDSLLSAFAPCSPNPRCRCRCPSPRPSCPTGGSALTARSSSLLTTRRATSA